jgi:pimeloyl-ACP methyl ester carboxylesterase
MTGKPCHHGKRARFWLAAAASVIAGCAHTPSADFYETASRLGFRTSLAEGGEFSHRVFVNARALEGPPKRLHLYIDGDGTPWLGTGRPARDPTPRDPLVLRLMALDDSPAVYLGRPCYAGENDPGRCTAWDWTHGRYSERVVESLGRAARRIVRQLGGGELVLIGYSGGGTLAMLLAERLDNVSDVVTVAGNLDVDGWARHHGFSPLTGSLDPARRQPLPPHIRQWHWAGRHDEKVPHELLSAATEDGDHVRVEIVDGFDHRCCWEERWPEILQTLSARP